MRFLSFILIVLLNALAAGQALSELEAAYTQLQQRIQEQQARLDSLKNLLEWQAAQIDQAKNREDWDKNQVRQLMSRGLQISEQVDVRQQHVADLRRKAEQIKWQLAQRYSALIDSLQQEKEANPERGGEELNRKLLFYTERYLLFSPAFRALSFDPAMIRQIDLSPSADSLERAFAMDYLRNAAADIDARLSQIKKDRRELEMTIQLEEKTREFLEEAGDMRFGLMVQPGAAASDQNAVQSGTGVDEQQDNFNAVRQMETISLFFDQLDTQDNREPLFPRTMSLGSNRFSISVEAYLGLLKEAEKRLQEFQSLISAKLQKNSGR